MLITGALFLTAAVNAQLPIVPRDSLPASGGTFWLMDDSSGTPPPYPMLPPGLENAVIYDLGNMQFLVDPGDLTSRNGASLSDISPPGDGGDSGGDGGSGTNQPAVTVQAFSTNDFWLELNSNFDPTNRSLSLNVHHPEPDQPFDIFLAPQLRTPGGFYWIARGLPGQTNFIITNLPPDCGFFAAGTTNGVDDTGLTAAYRLFVGGVETLTNDFNQNAIPDYWEIANFGNLSQPATADYDADGVNISSEYLSGTDPNKINFSLSVTSYYVNLNPVPVGLTISGGTPISIATLVDTTNFAAATWASYTPTPLINLGASQGWHDVWIGLRGRLPTSKQTWRWIRLKLDTEPPLLVITNPTSSTVTQPIIQLQGWCAEPLARISYDLTNAAGQLSNVRAFVLSQAYNTNQLDFGTSSFQAFDIPLAEGANTITLRATDFTGNTTTTNLTFTLDYSNKTNAPAVNLLWPQDGGQVSAASFTIRGCVDDFTATISASLVDADGTTNTYNGLVERDGKFWLQNLPLGPGTNAFQLTAKDAIGNASTTNIAVFASPVMLSIDFFEDLQPGRPWTDVYGSIDSSDYTVWVNGVQAETVGNSWSATNVPVPPGGMAVFLARAIPITDNGASRNQNRAALSYDAASDNPDSPDALDCELEEAKEPQAYQDAYDYSYHERYRLRTDFFEGEEMAPAGWFESTFSSDTVLHWQIDSGGTETINTHGTYAWDTSDQGPSVSSEVITWPAGSDEGTDSVSTSNSTGTNQFTGPTSYAPPTAYNSCHLNTIVTDTDTWYVDENGNKSHNT